MSITPKIAANAAAVPISDATTEFVTTGPFMLYGEKLMTHESIYLNHIGPSGAFIQSTNEDGPIAVRGAPNMIYVDAFGTFRLTKGQTAEAASAGYEEQ